LQDKRQLELLVQAFHGVGKKVTVETNGTIKPPNFLLENIDLWSVSPKLSNSGMKDKLNIEALQALAGVRSVQFKFVIESLEDVNEAFQTMDANNIHGPVILQPQGYGDIIKTLRKMALYVRSNYAYRDVRILPQLHVLLYGHKRGI
jgi:organic radical activating enzyme